MKDVSVKIERKADDPLCPRVSMGGNDEVGYYIVFRVEMLASQPSPRELFEINSVLKVFERCHTAIKAEAARIHKPPMQCEQCGSQANNQVLTPQGPHYGKLVCASCGAFLAWMPRPALPVNFAKLPKSKHKSGDTVPQITGRSPAQISFGDNCRNMMMIKFSDVLAPALFEAMLTITDATFWIANKDRAANEIRWPKEWCE